MTTNQTGRAAGTISAGLKKATLALSILSQVLRAVAPNVSSGGA